MTYIHIGKRTTYKDPWHTAKYIAVEEQGRHHCEICGVFVGDTIDNFVGHAHHAIVGRDKNCPEVDHIINVQIVCADCHEKRAHTWKNTVKCIKDAVRRFGADEVEKWLEQLAELGKRVQEQYNQVRQTD